MDSEKIEYTTRFEYPDELPNLIRGSRWLEKSIEAEGGKVEEIGTAENFLDFRVRLEGKLVRIMCTILPE